MTVTDEANPRIRHRREVPPGLILVLGVVVVPGLIMLVTPHGFEPGTAAFVYVAFAMVAGQTVAVLTAVGVLAAAVVRGTTLGRFVTFAIIAFVVIGVAVNTVTSYAEQMTRSFQ